MLYSQPRYWGKCMQGTASCGRYKSYEQMAYNVLAPSALLTLPHSSKKVSRKKYVNLGP